MGTRTQKLGFLAALSIIALLMCPSATAQARLSNSSSVVLTATMPSHVHLRSAVLPPPDLLQPNLQENNLRAGVIVLESQWTFAPGQSVWAESKLLAEPQTGAAIFALQSQPTEGAMPIFGFMPRALPQSVPLMRDFVPQRGPRSQMDGLLVLTPRSTETQVVLITVTAI